MEPLQSLWSSSATFVASLSTSRCTTAANTTTTHHAYSEMSYEEHESDEQTAAMRQSSERRLGFNYTKPLSYLRLLTFTAVIFPRSLKPAGNKKPHELHATAYLDALRGYAAWIVYNSHVIHEDWRPETGLLSIPWIKVVFRGHSMVDLFFIISGFALSYRILGFVHGKQPGRVLDSLASSTFRRYFRLFAPTAFATFVAMVAVTLGLLEKTEEPKVDQPTALGNLWFWVKDTVQASDPFPHVHGWWSGGIPGTYYLPQMWTIPLEFRGSMLLFLFCAATCRMTVRMRLLVTWISIIACFWWESAYAGLFLVGMWLADRRQYRNHQSITPSPPILPLQRPGYVSRTASESSGIHLEKASGSGVVSRSPSPFPSAQSALVPTSRPSEPSTTEPTLLQQLPYIILLFCSIIIITAPLLVLTTSDFPFNIIAYLKPPTYSIGALIHWPLSLGAIPLMFALEHAPILQKPLMTPFSQFVGELSFGIYAMHNTVRWIVWEKLFVKWQFAFWGPEAKSFFHFLPGYLVMTIIVIWAAELFRRVDVKAVAWSKVLQDWCFE